MTSDAFLRWYDGRPDGERYELLDGAVVGMEAERIAHTRLKYQVCQQLERGVKDAGLSFEALVDGMAVRIDDTTVFEPDALVRCGSRLPGDTTIVDDPVIVVEVLSPSTGRVDVLLKLNRYFHNLHVMHYLIVVPDGRFVIHHRRGSGEIIETASFDHGAIQLDPPGLRLSVDELFAAS